MARDTPYGLTEIRTLTGQFSVCPGKKSYRLDERTQVLSMLDIRSLARVHLRDMIEVGLVGRGLLAELPPAMAGRLEALLVESGR